jgi:hypothetical protein
VPEAGFTDRAISAFAVCRRDESSLAVLQALGGGDSTLVINGSNINVPRGGIIANSTSPTGLRVLGNGTLDAKYVETGSGTAQTTGSSSIDRSVRRGGRAHAARGFEC